MDRQNASSSLINRVRLSRGESAKGEHNIPHRERSKSDERVRPVLRPCGHRRSLSMPSLSKNVHFEHNLEDVCYFEKSEPPLAVSEGSSPVGEFQEEAHLYEWNFSTPNFPYAASQNSMLVRLERVYFSNDHMALLGSIVVANLAYEKSIICRFTMDYWKTISEVEAQHYRGSRCVKGQSYDQFIFSILLSEVIDLESKPLFLCIRYKVNGQEFWDNNSDRNFQIDFKKRLIR